MNKNKTLVKIEDNTRKAFDTGYIKGWSELHRQVIPNYGTVVLSEKFSIGSKIFFFEIGAQFIDNNQAIIEDSQIIVANDQLLLPGLIVTKQSINTARFGFTMRDGLDYFRVITSKVKEIKRGDFVIISRKQCHRFNYSGVDLFYVWPKAIVLVFNDQNWSPGPDFILGEVPKDNIFKSKQLQHVILRSGIDNIDSDLETTVYYSDYEFEFNLENRPFRAIRFDDILYLNSN